MVEMQNNISTRKDGVSSMIWYFSSVNEWRLKREALNLSGFGRALPKAISWEDGPVFTSIVLLIAGMPNALAINQIQL